MSSSSNYKDVIRPIIEAHRKSKGDKKHLALLLAVHVYLTAHDPEPLIELFESGFPLHEYPESREIIQAVLRGKGVRPEGRGSAKKTVERQSKEFEAMMYYWIEMHRTGGENKTAIQLGAAQKMNTTYNNFRKTILPKYPDWDDWESDW